MSDKSPRKSDPKKQGKTLKEKRLAKKEKEQTRKGFSPQKELFEFSI